MADTTRQEVPTTEDVLVYRGTVWRVESAPVVIDTDGAAELVEVWVRRGEDIGKPS